MPRQMRIEFAGAIYHVMSRGDRREPIFLDEGDRHDFLETLAEACHADLIVVGRSRHPALHLGGVPRRLLAMGHRPVLVVP